MRIYVGSDRSDRFFSNFALNPPVYVSFADRESGLIISNAKQSAVTELRGEWKGTRLKREERCERRELRKSATCLANSPLFSKRLSFQPNEQILRDPLSLSSGFLVRLAATDESDSPCFRVERYSSTQAARFFSFDSTQMQRLFCNLLTEYRI